MSQEVRVEKYRPQEAPEGALYREGMDWLERKQATLDQLTERYGAEWVSPHRDGLEQHWRYVADLEGFDPTAAQNCPVHCPEQACDALMPS